MDVPSEVRRRYLAYWPPTTVVFHQCSSARGSSSVHARRQLNRYMASPCSVTRHKLRTVTSLPVKDQASPNQIAFRPAGARWWFVFLLSIFLSIL
ncbi:hypothetical protein V2G26_000656 [Clonostachys chloroleuca]